MSLNRVGGGDSWEAWRNVLIQGQDRLADEIDKLSESIREEIASLRADLDIDEKVKPVATRVKDVEGRVDKLEKKWLVLFAAAFATGLTGSVAGTGIVQLLGKMLGF